MAKEKCTENDRKRKVKLGNQKEGLERNARLTIKMRAGMEKSIEKKRHVKVKRGRMFGEEKRETHDIETREVKRKKKVKFSKYEGGIEEVGAE